MFKLGLTKPIDTQDIYKNLAQHDSARITEKFNELWQQEKCQKRPRLLHVIRKIYINKLIGLSFLLSAVDIASRYCENDWHHHWIIFFKFFIDFFFIRFLTIFVFKRRSLLIQLRIYNWICCFLSGQLKHNVSAVCWHIFRPSRMSNCSKWPCGMQSAWLRVHSYRARLRIHLLFMLINWVCRSVLCVRHSFTER